ncbi:MAG: hypothetical protein ACM37U_02445, partial [Gemmatimonas sp.]
MLRRLDRQMTLAATAALALAGAARAQANPPRPTNDLPNPYTTVQTWAKLPEGRTWGSTSAVDIDKNGTSIWMAERCSTNSCATSRLDPILEFDSTGTVVAHFGAGLLIAPHGIHVDRDGNVWVTDCACTGGGGRRGGGRSADSTAGGRGAPAPAPAPVVNKGHQVFKFSPDGKVLMTLGAP